MASFRINFQAQTTGDHYIGYRTYNDPPNTYTVLTVNITGAVPQLAHVDIPVPGNLYCAYDDIVYTGYLIAACQPQTDGNGDGIPDLATQWTVPLIQQTDPCIETEILCQALRIDSVTNVPVLTGCIDGTYNLIITETNPGDELLPADIKLVVAGGVGYSIIFDNRGYYKAPPSIELPPALAACASHTSYTPVMTPTCPSIDLADYVCTTHTELSGDSVYTLSLGESVTICADVTTLSGLPAYSFLATPGSNCHCHTCENVIVITGGSSGYIDISYQVCWDGSNPLGPELTLISRRINYDEAVMLGCIMLNTITIDESKLVGGSTILSHSPCV